MKTLRIISIWSTLPLMLAVGAWTWLEDALARFGTRRQEAPSRRRPQG